jgi:hypothetical protein
MTRAQYEALLTGADDGSELAQLLAAAGGPATREELAGLGPALAAFRASAAVGDLPTRARSLRRWVVLKVLAVASGASLAGGVAYAATNGGLLGNSAPSQPRNSVSHTASAQRHGSAAGATPTSPYFATGGRVLPAVPPTNPSATIATPTAPGLGATQGNPQGIPEGTSHGRPQGAPPGGPQGSPHGGPNSTPNSTPHSSGGGNSRSAHATPTPPKNGQRSTGALHGPAGTNTHPPSDAPSDTSHGPKPTTSATNSRRVPPSKPNSPVHPSAPVSPS